METYGRMVLLVSVLCRFLNRTIITHLVAIVLMDSDDPMKKCPVGKIETVHTSGL